MSDTPAEAPTTMAASPVPDVSSPPTAPPEPVRAPAHAGPVVPARRLRTPSRGWRRKRSRRRSRAVAGRRVERVLRRVDPWSVLKFSAIFYVCVWVVLLTAAVLLWAVAAGAGAIEDVEGFIRDLFTLDSFAFEPGQLLRGFFVGGLVLVVAGTAANVLMAVVFNLISDIIGGVRVTMVDEEPPSRSVR